MTQDYFNDIPAWKQGDRTIPFEITADKVSGRIPVLRLECWEDFTPFLGTPFFSETSTEYIFRGQRRYNWGLTPSLGRYTKDGIVTEQLAQRQLDLFKRAARGRLLDGNVVEDEDELWAIGQHYGLRTPLLDWTYSPYVALFFSFSQPDSEVEDDNPYRAVYILNKTFIENDGLVPDIRVLEPKKDDHGRLVNQAGLFTFSPQDATIENKLTEIITSEDFMIGEKHYSDLSPDEEATALARYICKIYIKNERQKDCIRHLRRMNVHHASLFPDLIGASQYCNLLIDESDAVWKRESEGTSAHTTTESAIQIPQEETAPVAASPELIGSIRELVAHHCAPMNLPPLRLDDIADRLSRSLEAQKGLDWQQKESIQAKIKTTARVLLRKYDIPEGYRNPIIEQIVDVLIREEQRNEDEQTEDPNITV